MPHKSAKLNKSPIEDLLTAVTEYGPDGDGSYPRTAPAALNVTIRRSGDRKPSAALFALTANPSGIAEIITGDIVRKDSGNKTTETVSWTQGFVASYELISTPEADRTIEEIVTVYAGKYSINTEGTTVNVDIPIWDE